MEGLLLRLEKDTSLIPLLTISVQSSDLVVDFCLTDQTLLLLHPTFHCNNWFFWANLVNHICYQYNFCTLCGVI